MKAKVKIALLKLFGLSLTVVPVLAVIISKWEEYTEPIPEQIIPATIKLSAGAVVGITIAGFAALGKLKLPGGWVFLGLMFGLAWALEPVIHDLVLFLGIAFAGATADHVFIQGVVKTMEETRVMDKQARITASAIKETNSTIGRV